MKKTNVAQLAMPSNNFRQNYVRLKSGQCPMADRIPIQKKPKGSPINVKIGNEGPGFSHCRRIYRREKCPVSGRNISQRG